METKTDKETSLLEDHRVSDSSDHPQRHDASRRRSTSVLCALIVILSTVFGAAFVGGYFTGVNNTEKASNSESQAHQNRAWRVYYDGKSHIIPAFQGNVPVEAFVQGRTVMIESRLVSVPGNPLLTPKGTSQIFIYQYDNTVSFVLTATGNNYGETVSNPTLSGEGQYTVTSSGLRGDLIQLRDGYHQLYDSVPIPDVFSMDLQWGNVGSSGFIVTLSNVDFVNATIHFSKLKGEQQPLNIRGGYEYDTEIAVLPTPEMPLIITHYTGKYPSNNNPDSERETPMHSSCPASNMKVVRLDSDDRRRRSMNIRNNRGIAFILSDPLTKDVLHRIELRREDRHGGRNGSLCWKVENHVHHVEASFCSLFHETLYNGIENETGQDCRSTMMLNVHFRFITKAAEALDEWKHGTSLIHDFNSDGVLRSLNARKKRTLPDLLRKPTKHLRRTRHVQSHEMNEELERIVSAAQYSLLALLSDNIYIDSDLSSNIYYSRRRLLWNCGCEKSLQMASRCIKDSAFCSTRLAGVSFGSDRSEKSHSSSRPQRRRSTTETYQIKSYIRRDFNNQDASSGRHSGIIFANASNLHKNGNIAQYGASLSDLTADVSGEGTVVSCSSGINECAGSDCL